MNRKPAVEAIFQTPDLFAAILTGKEKLLDANQGALDLIERPLEAVIGEEFRRIAWWDHYESFGKMD